MDCSTFFNDQGTARSLFQTRLRYLYNRRLQLARAAIIARLKTLRGDLEGLPAAVFEHGSEARHSMLLQTVGNNSGSETEALGYRITGLPPKDSLSGQNGRVLSFTPDHIHTHLRGEHVQRAWNSGKKVAQLVSTLRSSLFLSEDSRDFIRIVEFKKIFTIERLLTEPSSKDKSGDNEHSLTNDDISLKNDTEEETAGKIVDSKPVNSSAKQGQVLLSKHLEALVKLSSVEGAPVELKFNVAGSSQIAMVVQAYFSREFRSLRFSDNCKISFAGRTENELTSTVRRYLDLICTSYSVHLMKKSKPIVLPNVHSDQDDMQELPSESLSDSVPQSSNDAGVLKNDSSIEPRTANSDAMRYPETAADDQKTPTPIPFQNHEELVNTPFVPIAENARSTPESFDFFTWPTGVSLFDTGHSAYASATQIARAETYDDPYSPTRIHYPYRTTNASVEKSSVNGGNSESSFSSPISQTGRLKLSLNLNNSSASSSSVAPLTKTPLQTPVVSSASIEPSNHTALKNSTASVPFFVSSHRQNIAVPSYFETSSQHEEYEIDHDGKLNLIKPN